MSAVAAGGAVRLPAGQKMVLVKFEPEEFKSMFPEKAEPALEDLYKQIPITGTRARGFSVPSRLTTYLQA